MRRVGNALTRREEVGVFGSALLRHEGVRGFGFGIGCSGVIQMARDGRRQVGVGRIGVGTVMVVTERINTPKTCPHLDIPLLAMFPTFVLGNFLPSYSLFFPHKYCILYVYA